MRECKGVYGAAKGVGGACLLDPSGAVLHERILEAANALVELALLG